MMCFRLLDKETGEAMELNKVDEEICELLGEPVDPNYYCPIFKHPRMNISWYDSIGMALACGKSYAECRELTDNEVILKVIDYLESKYVPDAFYQAY